MDSLLVETNAVDNLFFERRSIRRYRPDPVPQALIKRVLESAIWSPSAHNRQPWRFCAVTDDAVKAQLAAAMGARLRADLAADGVAQEAIDADAGRSYARITSAPALILLALSMVDMDRYTDDRRYHLEYMMAAQSTAMAGQNLLLAAHAHGLGACWMCAPLFVPEIVSVALDLPEDWQPQALITLGYAAETRTKTRHPLEKSLLWR